MTELQEQTDDSDSDCGMQDPVCGMTVTAASEHRYEHDDQLYFSRLFSKTIGKSPRSYRASIRA